MKISFISFLFCCLILFIWQDGYPQWEKTSFNLNTTSIVSFQNYLFAANPDSGIFKSSDYGATWTSDNYGVIGFHALYVSGNYLLAAGNGLFLSSNKGVSWISMWPATGTSFISIASIGDNIVAGSIAGNFGSAVYHSSDFGLSWEKVIPAYREVETFNSRVAGNNFYIADGDRFYKSTDYGHSWLEKDLFPEGIYDLLKSGSRILGVGLKAYISTDEGANWFAQTNGLTQVGYQYFNALALSDTSMIVIGADYGFYMSTNNGSRWKIINEGFTGSQVQSLVVSGQYLFGGTKYGIWRRPLSTIVSINKEKNEMPGQFVLEQNFPNPFNPSTIIKYSLPYESDVKLSISNIIGQIVKEENFGMQSTGIHETSLMLSELPGGVYFYTLQINASNGADNFRTTKKMVLLK